MNDNHEIKRLLHQLVKQGERVMATQAELAKILNEVSDQLVKVGKETAALIQTVADLKATVVNVPVSPELQAAVDKVAAQAKVVNDMMPDVPPVTP